MKHVVSILMLILLVACGGSKQVQAPPPSDSVAEYLPVWWGQNDNNYYTGDAQSESKDRMFALNKAKSSAINDISQQMEVRNQSMMKQFKDETGVGAESEILATATEVIKQTTSAVLRGLNVDKQELRKNPKTNVYTAYVKVTLPKAQIANELLKKMKAKEKLYTKFQASKAFKELEKEADKFDEYKEKND